MNCCSSSSSRPRSPSNNQDHQFIQGGRIVSNHSPPPLHHNNYRYASTSSSLQQQQPTPIPYPSTHPQSQSQPQPQYPYPHPTPPPSRPTTAYSNTSSRRHGPPLTIDTRRGQSGPQPPPPPLPHGAGVVRPAPVYPSSSTSHNNRRTPTSTSRNINNRQQSSSTPSPSTPYQQSPQSYHQPNSSAPSSTPSQLSPAGWEASSSTTKLIRRQGSGANGIVTPQSSFVGSREMGNRGERNVYTANGTLMRNEMRDSYARSNGGGARSVVGPAVPDERGRLSPSARVVQDRIRESNEGKLSVGIDFGTTFSGCAFGSTRLFSGQIRQILTWPGSYEHYRKVPSCILYSQPDPTKEAQIIAWGLDAKNLPAGRGMIKCEWFKLLLSPDSLVNGPDPRLPPLPAGKDAVDVIADFLRCLWTYAKGRITEEIGAVVDLDSADVLLTVPAAWDAAGCALMREAAIRAGLVQSSRAGDRNWRDRLRIITEPEAAAIHASTLSSLHHLQPSQSFVICDAGGGTVDCAVYRLLGELSQLEIAEMCIRSGMNCGSLFVDLKFEEVVRNLLKDHPIHLDAPSMGAFMHAFSEVDKLSYQGNQEDDDALFRFDVFNVEDCDDPAIGLEYGQLAIPGKVIKEQVFNPIIDQVLSLLHLQLSKLPPNVPIDAIILVGGFAASEYLFTRVQQEFKGRVGTIARPADCDVATLRGAARYGLGLREKGGQRGMVSSVIAPRSYCMKVKLPAEPVDFFQRPQFIMLNDANLNVCSNRLSYLVEKGAVLKKGVRLRSRFCKFSKGVGDSFFTAVLYSSDGDLIYRYTDEGQTTELCRWTVDLALLPNFHRICQTGGGYVEFDLGLELDSAEVRGVLLSDEGIECGRATFEFLGGG